MKECTSMTTYKAVPFPLDLCINYGKLYTWGRDYTGLENSKADGENSMKSMNSMNDETITVTGTKETYDNLTLITPTYNAVETTSVEEFNQELRKLRRMIEEQTERLRLLHELIVEVEPKKDDPQLKFNDKSFVLVTDYMQEQLGKEDKKFRYKPIDYGSLGQDDQKGNSMREAGKCRPVLVTTETCRPKDTESTRRKLCSQVLTVTRAVPICPYTDTPYVVSIEVDPEETDKHEMVISAYFVCPSCK
jgi:hypothetical protein